MTSAGTGKPERKAADARWERLQDLFSQAADMPPPERDAFVAQQTRDDPDLREELAGLLACDNGKSTGPLTHALGAALDNTTRDKRRAFVGRTLGNYKLVSVLGHGGTGTVYLGERSDRQYSAQVAIKIVDHATVQGDLGLRFRAERQILASLNHPNIARLIDAGETDEGQPYLVMEYVHGDALDRFCDSQQLDIRARLELFLEICNAVQYAHQNLIVHRDLKPANILVTPEGAPKLLDFGIAKLLDVGDAASVLALTRMNDRLLTPEYASPEQILGRTVTTASDVYALGVVLYELMTGLRPYVVPASASQLELERSICVTDPARPSATVRRAIDNGSAEGQSSIDAIASARALSPDKLQRRLVGDIDAIVMRALRKEPQHRYGSVEQLAADIKRYLAREPVQARQGNWLYYSQRFVRRHAFGVAAGIGFLTFIIAFAVMMSAQNQRIAAERDRATQEGERAEQVSAFMLGIFAAADPFTSQGHAITASDLLDKAGRRIRDDLGQHPEVRARLLEAIGRAYRRQNQFDRSVVFLRDALRIREQLPDSDSAQIATILTELSVSLRQTGDFEESDKALQKALAVAHNGSNERTSAYARLLTNIGRLEQIRGNLDKAQEYFARSLALNRELLGPRDPEVAQVLIEQSNLYLWTDDLKNAERSAQEAVDIFSSTLAERHPDRVLANFRLGEVLLNQGRLEDASPILEGTLEDHRALFGDDSRQVADNLDSLAQIRRRQKRWKEAERYAREGLTIQQAALGANHYMTGYYKTSLASILIAQRKYGEAGAELRGALDIFARALPPDHQYAASAEHLLGEVLLETNELSAAEAMLSAAMNRAKRTGAPAWRIARSQSAYGEALARQRRGAEAENYLVESYRTLSTDGSADPDALRKARERVTRFYTDRGQRDKLDELMLATRQEDMSVAPTRPN